MLNDWRIEKFINLKKHSVSHALTLCRGHTQPFDTKTFIVNSCQPLELKIFDSHENKIIFSKKK